MLRKILALSAFLMLAPAAFAGSGPGGFPLPKDAVVSKLGPGGTSIQVFEVPRARSVVLAEIREALKADGWTIVSETNSPSGNAVRMSLKKGDMNLGARFTGDDSRTAIILTLP